MDTYELTFILRGDLSEKERDDGISQVRKWVEEGKGKVVSSDLWGKKSLAYRIKKFLEGIYVFMRLDLGAKEVAQLSGKLRLEENVIRYLLVKK